MKGSLAEVVNVPSKRLHLCQFCTVYFVDPSQQQRGIITKISFDFWQNITYSGQPFKTIFITTLTMMQNISCFSLKHIAGLLFT